jgi:hypothetical protein
MNVVLLLTGTVEPGNMVLTRLLDPKIRKQQYLDSLNFWQRNTNLPIVFVENSNVDLSTYFESAISSHRLETLTFKENDLSKNRGKGFGEINCMVYAHSHSILLANADFIFKITGRLKILNFKSFYKHADIRNLDVTADLNNELNYADSRLWGYRPEFFSKHLLGFQDMLNDLKGIYFEHILAKSIKKAIKEGDSFSAFDTRLRIEGVSGTSNKSYNSSFSSWYIRNLIKKIRYRSLTKTLNKIKP